MKITYLKAFTDNYIWIIEQARKVIIVDPGSANEVLDYIIANDVQPIAILLTHEHMDHCGGVVAILAKFDIPVYGYGEQASIKVVEGDEFKLLDILRIKVIETHGHTFDGVSYLVDDQITKQRHLFCGDTLFGAGCGRVFTGDYSVMFKSLAKINKLDRTTLIYPAHEYTLQNLQFAKTVDANNMNVDKRIINDTNHLSTQGITLPTNLALEQQTNPFLRVDDKDLQVNLAAIIKQPIIDEFDCFVKLRQLKDNF